MTKTKQYSILIISILISALTIIVMSTNAKERSIRSSENIDSLILCLQSLDVGDNIKVMATIECLRELREDLEEQQK